MIRSYMETARNAALCLLVGVFSWAALVFLLGVGYDLIKGDLVGALVNFGRSAVSAIVTACGIAIYSYVEEE